VWLLGIVGAVLAAVALIGSNLNLKYAGQDFLLPTGVILALLGLGYLWGFVGLYGAETDFGIKSAKVIGAVGAIVFVVALGRSILARYGWLGVERDLAYLPTTGTLLMLIGAVYVMWAFLIGSEAQVVVLTRRELGSYFYSPVAYFLMIGLAIFAWF